MTLPLVILAGGLSTRYGRLKQLDPLGPSGESIMDYNVFDAARAGFDEMIFVVRREIEQDIRDHVAAIVGDAVPMEFVHQGLEDVPDGYGAPPDRARPWGTGHAVLSASQLIHGPFAVCNADDLYGPGAFRMMHEHLSAQPVPTEAALVAYPLNQTLSGSGGVARGVCVLSRDGMLSRVSEVQQIRRTDHRITGVYTDGSRLELSGGEIVSMNLGLHGAGGRAPAETVHPLPRSLGCRHDSRILAFHRGQRPGPSRVDPRFRATRTRRMVRCDARRGW